MFFKCIILLCLDDDENDDNAYDKYYFNIIAWVLDFVCSCFFACCVALLRVISI